MSTLCYLIVFALSSLEPTSVLCIHHIIKLLSLLVLGIAMLCGMLHLSSSITRILPDYILAASRRGMRYQFLPVMGRSSFVARVRA